MKNTSLAPLASVVTLFGLVAAFSIVASSGVQAACCTTVTTYPSGNVFWLNGSGSDEADSFITKHTWKLQSPGTFVLDSTKFTIAFNVGAVSYDLMYDGKWVANSISLHEMQVSGIARAIDMQEAGLLK
jgi:hypothetical protein